MTDGANMARSRCGNRLSFVPYQPSLDVQEPHERDLDAQEPLIAKLPEGPLLSPGFPDAATPEQFPGGPGAAAPVASPYTTPARSGAATPFTAANFLGPMVPMAIGGPFFAPFVSPPDNGGNTPPGNVVPPPGGGVTPVPEPRNALLFLLAAAGVFLLRPKKLRSGNQN